MSPELPEETKSRLPIKPTVTNVSAAAAAILALIGGISYILYPSPKTLAWEQSIEPMVIDKATGMPALPNQYSYFYTLSPLIAMDTSKECAQEWTTGINAETLRNGIHVGGGFGLSTSPEYRCDVSTDTIYVLGGDNNYWSWSNQTWNLIGSTTPVSSIPYPVNLVLTSTVTAQLTEVTCVDKGNPLGFNCTAPFEQIRLKLPGGVVNLTVYSMYNGLTSPPSMQITLRDAVVVIQESFNSNQIESR